MQKGMEVKAELKTISVDYECPECKKGCLRPTRKVLLSKPPKYPHVCDQEGCDYKMTFKKKYPYIYYEEV